MVSESSFVKTVSLGKCCFVDVLKKEPISYVKHQYWYSRQNLNKSVLIFREWKSYSLFNGPVLYNNY